MRRVAVWSLALAAGLVPGAPLWAAEKGPLPVEEWQINGVLLALEDGHDGVRFRAALKLAQLLQPDPSTGGLERIWNGDSRRLARQAIDRLLILLGDGKADPQARSAAALALGWLGPPMDRKVVDKLVTVLKERDKAPGVRGAAILALSWLGARQKLPEVGPLLRGALVDGDNSVFRATAEALARLGGPADEKVITRLVQRVESSADAAERRAAAGALERIDGGRAALDARVRYLLSFVQADGKGAPAVARMLATALGRLGAHHKLPEPAVTRLCQVLGESTDLGVCKAAILALGQLGAQNDSPGQAVAKLNGLLLKQDLAPELRRDAIGALGSIGGQWELPQAVTGLSRLLEDGRPEVRGAAVAALGKLGARRKLPETVVSSLCRLLEDPKPEVRRQAVWALGEVGSNHQLPEQAVTQLGRLLSTGEDFSVLSVAEAFGKLNAPNDLFEKAVSDLLRRIADREPPSAPLVMALGALGARRKLPESAVASLYPLLDNQKLELRRAAVGALTELSGHNKVSPQAVRKLIGLLKDQDPLVRGSASALLRGTQGDHLPREEGEQAGQLVIAALQLPYQDTSTLPEARFLAHYWGGGDEEARLLCAYLGRPKSQPSLPKTRQDARKHLEVLEKAWEGDQPFLHEDAAGWVALIITNEAAANAWGRKDVALLERYRDLLARDELFPKGAAYAAAVQRIIDPLTVSPPPWVRTLLAVAVANLLALLLIVLRPGQGGLEQWLPFLGYAGVGVGSWSADLVTQLHLLPWLLGGLLLGELVLLIGAGVLSPALLRQLASIEPLNRLAVPLALRLPWGRRRLFHDHVAAVRNQLERDKRQASDERYLALPADIGFNNNRTPKLDLEPALTILRFLSEPVGQRGHVLIEAPGGRGKSALLREVVRLALDQFHANPAGNPLPVLLTGTAQTIDELAESTLAGALLAPEFLKLHLQAGDFLLVLDGVSESGLADKALSQFVHGPYGAATPLLLSSRPTPTYRHIIEGSATWLVAEPRRLDESILAQFVKHYGGNDLSDPVKSACRGGPDQTYLPVLVRMAMTIAGTAPGSVSVADIYHAYILRLFKAQLPDEAERFKQLEEAARWCLETYWQHGWRKCPYTGEQRLQHWLRAGILVPADSLGPPREVQFFHDSMQSYLTAYALAAQDKAGYRQLPRPVDDEGTQTWDRGRVLLWAVANRKFARTSADILGTGGTELFQMCLATFTPRQELRRWLNDELVRWANRHDEDLRRKDVLAAISPPLAEPIKGTRGAANLLKKAASASLEADEKDDGVEALAFLYAGLARFVYDLRASDEKEGAEAEANAIVVEAS
jgi:HEAT repeat protein